MFCKQVKLKQFINNEIIVENKINADSNLKNLLHSLHYKNFSFAFYPKNRKHEILCFVNNSDIFLFYLGISAIVVGGAVAIVDILFPHKFSTILEVDYGMPYR